MKRWIILVSAVALFGACGGSKTETKQDDTVTEQQNPTTVEEEPIAEEPAEPEIEPMVTQVGEDGTIPAPSTVAGPPEHAERTESGLAYVVIKEGDGQGTPTVEQTVTAHYTGWTTDGSMFDSSFARGEPFTAPLNKLIVGWQEGMSLMSRGEQRRFWIPEELAYQGREGAPQGMLVFDVELVDFE